MHVEHWVCVVGCAASLPDAQHPGQHRMSQDLQHPDVQQAEVALGKDQGLHHEIHQAILQERVGVVLQEDGTQFGY